MQNMINALEAARHELTILHGLVAADGASPGETFSIDTSAAVRRIDAVLKCYPVDHKAFAFEAEIAPRGPGKAES